MHLSRNFHIIGGAGNPSYLVLNPQRDLMGICAHRNLVSTEKWIRSSVSLCLGSTDILVLHADVKSKIPGTWLRPNISIPFFQDFLGSKDLNSFFFFIFPNPGIGISVQSRDPKTRGKMSPQQTFLEEFSVYFNMNEIYWSAKSNWMAVAPMFCFFIWWVEDTIRNYLVIN